MNNELQITINGKPATTLMFKYKLEDITATLAHKFVDGMKPKLERIDRYFVEH